MFVKRVKTTKNYYLRAKRGGLVCGKLLKTTKNDDAPSKARLGCVPFQVPRTCAPPSSREHSGSRFRSICWGKGMGFVQSFSTNRQMWLLFFIGMTLGQESLPY